MIVGRETLHPMDSLQPEDVVRGHFLACVNISMVWDGDLRYLACLNHAMLKAGEHQFSPWGGALKVREEGKEALNDIIEAWEFDYVVGIPKKDEDDLRFKIRVKNIPALEFWYRFGSVPQDIRSLGQQTFVYDAEAYAQQFRQRELYPIHELEEELIELEQVIVSLSGMRMTPQPYSRLEEWTRSTRPSLRGMLTKSYTDFFNVELSPEQREQAYAALDKNPRLALLSMEEIRQGYAENGVPISRLFEKMLR